MASNTALHVHSLVVMTISDHHIREVQRNFKSSRGDNRVVGFLLGVKMEDGSVEAISALPLPFELKGNAIKFDEAAFIEDVKNYRELFPEQNIVGWYSTALSQSKTDVAFHRDCTEFARGGPFYYLRLDPRINLNAKSLPLTAYALKGDTHMQVPHKLVTGEEERVTVDFVVQERSNNIETDGPMLAPKRLQLEGAITDMGNRIGLIVTYLKDIESKKVEPDQKILRQIKTLCNRLPIMEGDGFQKKYAPAKEEAEMIRYMATLTTSTSQITKTLHKYGTAIDGAGASGRMGGKISSFPRGKFLL